MPQQDRFLFGGSFVPLALEMHIPMSQWEDGMRQMRDLGFNAFRAFVAWNRPDRAEFVIQQAVDPNPASPHAESRAGHYSEIRVLDASNSIFIYD